VREIFKSANGRGYTGNYVVGMLTVDVKNAFNCAPWHSIMEALRDKNVPQYLRRIIGAYLSKRRVNITLPGGRVRVMDVNCGVPQGSVLGPDLWNILYDGLLRIPLPPDVEIIAFADDVALIASAQVNFLLDERLEVSFRDVTRWLETHGLEVAVNKTEALVLTYRNVHNTMQVTYNEHVFRSQKSLRYLGVQLDARMRFADHAELAAKRAADACRQVARLMPNARGPRQSSRRLLASVVMSRLLYGAPIWYPSISVKALSRMSTVARRTC